MRRPGMPVRSKIDFHATIERALAEERASALGRAGEALEDALDDHRLLVEVGSATAEQVTTSLRAVRDAAWALIVQREAIGFRQDNLAWIRQHYDIPREVLRRI